MTLVGMVWTGLVDHGGGDGGGVGGVNHGDKVCGGSSGFFFDDGCPLFSVGSGMVVTKDTRPTSDVLGATIGVPNGTSAGTGEVSVLLIVMSVKPAVKILGRQPYTPEASGYARCGPIVWEEGFCGKLDW